MSQRRKRSLLAMDDTKDDDIDIMDLTTNNSNNSNSNNRKKVVAKKKYSNGNKISYLGSSKTLSKDGSWIGMIAIRNEIYEFVRDEKRVSGLIEMIQSDMKRRALGADIQYKQMVNKNGKMVMVKQPFMSHLNYAKKINAKGGGSTAFTPLETALLVDGACPIVAQHWKALKCNPALEPYASGNIGKIHKTWVYLIVTLNLGERFASLLNERGLDCFRKKMKGMCTKKKTDSDSIRIRSIFAKWGGPKDVIQTNIQGIKRSTAPQSQTPTPKAQSTPCLPLKQKKPPISKQVHEKAMVVLEDLHKKILNGNDECKHNNNDILSIPNIVATPPITPTIATTQAPTAVPPNGFMDGELAFYAFISQIYEMKNENGITDDIKESTVSSLMKAWHNKDLDGSRNHISNLVSFIGNQSHLSDQGKLRMVRLDLNEFLLSKQSK